MKTANEFMADMLERVPSDVDKREGSLIHTALAPVSAQLEEAYLYIDNTADTMMPDTARGEDQDRVNEQQGVIRTEATAAVRRGEFTTGSEGAPATVAIGSRFSGGGVVYVASELIEAGTYRFTCETAGAIGNAYFGSLLPLENHSPALATAELTDVLIQGEDVEDDEHYRARYTSIVRSRPFGGNRAQYESEILQIAGVGGVHAYRRPESGIYVTCVICSSTMGVASPELVAAVQEAIDPVPSGEGLGIAPIGHRVNVISVTACAINVTADVAPVSGTTVVEAQAQADTAISAYLQSISFTETVVRIARIETLLLNLDAVVDVANTKINGVAANLALSATYELYEVPELGTVTLTEL
jgi:uncharacterized phage protein gp47/JayE